MAKFKVGDRVTDGSAIYAITGVDDDIYEWKVVSGKADPSYSEGGEVAWAEAKMRLANAVSNAKDAEGNIISVGDTVILAEEGDADNPKEFKVKSLEGHYVYLGNLRHEYDKDLLVYNAHKSVRSSNAVVRNALAALVLGIEAANARTARNAGIWGSAKEAEDRSDVFVRAALGRTKYNFDTEAGTLREVIKLLASAEQTPKIKKNTEKLKDILSRVEKAGALFKGI